MVCGSIPRWLSHPASTGYRVAFPGGEEAVAWLWPLTPIWHQGYKKSTHMPLFPICGFMACSMVDFTCTCYPSAVLTWFLYTSLCKSTPPLRQYGNPLPNATLPSAFLTICVWKWLNIRGGFRSLKALNACGQTCALVTKAPRKLSSLATQTLCKYLVFKNVYILRDVWGV